jgi:tetratricopeptide (TPR) repeat protein
MMTDWKPLNIVLASSQVPWMSLTEVPLYSYLINNLHSQHHDPNIESILQTETQQTAYKLELQKNYKQAAETMLQALVMAKSSSETQPNIVHTTQAKLMGSKFVEVILSWVDFYIRRNQKEVTYELLKMSNSYTSSSKKYPLKNKKLLRIRTLILYSLLSTATYYIKETKYSSAQECLTRGFKYLNSSNDHTFYSSIMLSLIALCYHETKDYEAALKSNKKSFKRMQFYICKKNAQDSDCYQSIILFNIAMHHLGLYQKSEAVTVLAQAMKQMQGAHAHSYLETKVINTMQQIVGSSSTRSRYEVCAKIPETAREDSKIYDDTFIRLDKKQRLAPGSKKPSKMRIHKHHLFSRVSQFTPVMDQGKGRTGRSVPLRKPQNLEKKTSPYSFEDAKKASPTSNDARTPSRNQHHDCTPAVTSRFRADFNIKNNAALVIQKHWHVRNARRRIDKIVYGECDRVKKSILSTLCQAAQKYSAIHTLLKLAYSCYYAHADQVIKRIKKTAKRVQVYRRNLRLQTVQACMRGYLIRRSIRIITVAAVKIQACFKGKLQRKKYQAHKKQDSSTSLYLDYEQTHENLMTPEKAALVIQARYKGFVVRNARKREQSARKLQKVYRGFLVRRDLGNIKEKCVRIQAAVRKRQNQMRYRLMKEAAARIQRVWRGCKVRSKLNLMQSSAILIQSFYRGYRDRKLLTLKHESARVIQSWVRSWNV